MSTYLVLGLGLQGTAAAHDLVLHGGATRLILVDSDGPRLAAAKSRLESLTGFLALEAHEIAVATEPSDASTALREAFDAADLVMNCLPYRFSIAMTALALEAGCHIADLGGNTAIVRRQLELAAEHPRGKEVAVLPDCGLMPGMGNLFVAHAIAEFGRCDSVHVRCGGLMSAPSGPLDYALLFNVYGLINEYFGKAQVLRGGRVEEIDTFGELEELAIDFERRGLPARACEAFITSGGLSTTPWTFADQIGELDYKTVRYKGHHAKFKLLVDLGLLEEQPIDLPRGGSAVPRDVLAAALTQTLTVPDVDDLAFLRCTAKSGDRTLELEMFDRKSPETGFTAMERTTAYSATACLTGVLSGHTRPAAGPIETAVDTAWYLEALGERGIEVVRH
jgi:lysine 6-dehydrogenase